MRLWRLIGRGLLTVFPSYRPERHYMRGPGPRWREKNSNAENWPSKCAVEEPYVPRRNFPNDVATFAMAHLADREALQGRESRLKASAINVSKRAAGAI